ncbi:MAG: demethoxyubiquinone hydroxylase family protein [Gammaproteobacteria bacterium]
MQAATNPLPRDIAPLHVLQLPEALAADLQSDHAGETGAVYIYLGILSVSRDPAVLAFAREHLATEREHLAFFEEWLPRSRHSALLPVWRLSGWLLGALPALFGAGAVFTTIAAVETFVEDHYQAQIDALAGTPRWSALRDTLIGFCADEVAHRDDAAGRTGASASVVARTWSAVVDVGSRVGVFLARRL